jgi:putative FmdB family regulatory protein
MPIYEYICDGCQHQFEQMRRITDETMPACPSCESENVRKLISLSAFHLKGSGWYVTDYGGKKNGAVATDPGNGNGASHGSEAVSATESKTESKPESKTEKKTETKAAESKTADS